MEHTQNNETPEQITPNAPDGETLAEEVSRAVADEATADADQGLDAWDDPDEPLAPSEAMSESTPPPQSALPIVDKEEFVSAIEEFRERASGSTEFRAANGNEYILTPFDAWTFRQNRVATITFEMIEKKIGDVRKLAQGFGMQTIMNIVNDETIWCQFFHMLYVPKDLRMYDPEQADQAKEDMLDLDNKHAIGAIYHFFMSFASFIPSAIRIFFQANPTLYMMLTSVLEEARKHPFTGSSPNASPTR